MKNFGLLAAVAATVFSSSSFAVYNCRVQSPWSVKNRTVQLHEPRQGFFNVAIIQPDPSYPRNTVYSNKALNFTATYRNTTAGVSYYNTSITTAGKRPEFRQILQGNSFSLQIIYPNEADPSSYTVYQTETCQQI